MSKSKMQWKHNEPLFWSLFGAGGVVTAFITPVLVAIVGIMVPLGILPADVMSYDRMLGFANTWTGKLLLLIVISMSLWHCVHRIYHSLHDFGFHPAKCVRALAYGSAFTLSTACLVLVLIV